MSFMVVSRDDCDAADPSELGSQPPRNTNVDGDTSNPGLSTDSTGIAMRTFRTLVIPSSTPSNQYISSGAHLKYSNLAFSRPGPYKTPWVYHPQSMWSRGLIENGRFDKDDAALVAFIVDCAMMLYIRMDTEMPVQDNTRESELGWRVIFEVYAKVSVRVALHGHPLATDTTCVESTFFIAMDGVMRILERHDIRLRQHIQDPITRHGMALYIIKQDSFRESTASMIRAFKWVYGQGPVQVLNAGLKEEEFTRDLISIRKWILDYN